MFWLLVLLPLTGAMCFGELYRRYKKFAVRKQELVVSKPAAHLHSGIVSNL